MGNLGLLIFWAKIQRTYNNVCVGNYEGGDCIPPFKGIPGHQVYHCAEPEKNQENSR
jgi:hypothetical protein